jgi:hypothetical protein
MASVLKGVVKACAPSMDSKLQELTIELPARPLSVPGDVRDLVRAFTVLLLNESRSAPVGNELILAVTASDFDLSVSISKAGVAARERYPSDELDRPGTGVVSLDTTADDANLAGAKRIIVAAGGTIEGSDWNGGVCRHVVVRLPLSTQ